MAARERQRDVLRLRGVQNVLVLHAAASTPIRPVKKYELKRAPELHTYLGHEELVDDPALPVVDGDLVGRDACRRGSRGGGRLLQLRGARSRAADRPATARGQRRSGACEDVWGPLASPPQAARSSVRAHASPEGRAWMSE
jgi:hypothetical protein